MSPVESRYGQKMNHRRVSCIVQYLCSLSYIGGKVSLVTSLKFIKTKFVDQFSFLLNTKKKSLSPQKMCWTRSTNTHTKLTAQYLLGFIMAFLNNLNSGQIGGWWPPGLLTDLILLVVYQKKKKQRLAYSSATHNNNWLAHSPALWTAEWPDKLRLTSSMNHCEKCDWMTGKQAGQHFHENRAKFDQKSPFNIVRASGDCDSACFPMQDYGARRSDRWWKRAEGKQVVVVVGEGREKI